MSPQNQVRCPHGIVCDFVYTYTTIGGEQYVVGGAYWHTPEERCSANPYRRPRINK